MGGDARVEAALARARARKGISARFRGNVGCTRRKSWKREAPASAKALLEVFQSRAGKVPIVLRCTESSKENARPKRSFFFQQRHGRLDLRSIARIDIEKIVEEVDIETIQNHLENITFAEFEQRDLQVYTDENFLKLFQLTQLTIEYLLNVQHTLYTYTSTLESQLKQVQHEHEIANGKLQIQDEQLQSLQRDVKQRERTLQTYEFLLTQKSSNDDVFEREIKIPEMDVAQVAKEITQTNEQLLRDQREEMKAQAEAMKKVLREEVDEVKRQLSFELEKEKERLEARASELEKREKELMDCEKRRRRYSLAGTEIEEDFDVDIESEVEQILQTSASLKDVRSQLGEIIQENQKLRKEIANAESKAFRTSQIEKDRSFEVTKNETIEPKEESQVEKKLIHTLAKAHVDENLATRRSMQLRRVLRLARRRLQLQAFTSWRIAFVGLQGEYQRNSLQKEVLSLQRLIDTLTLEAERSRFAEDNALEEAEEGQKAEVQFIPTYEWEKAPSTYEIPKMLDVRPGPDGSSNFVRIPEVWVLKVATSFGAIVSTPVEKKLSVFEVRDRLGHELDLPMTKVLLKDEQTGAILPNSATVESANFFHSKPIVFIVQQDQDQESKPASTEASSMNYHKEHDEKDQEERGDEKEGQENQRDRDEETGKKEGNPRTIPVNFGDYESSIDGAKSSALDDSRFSQLTSTGESEDHSVGSTDKSSKLRLDVSDLSITHALKDELAATYGRAIAGFGRSGTYAVANAAQKFNYSFETGSSNSVTSMSSRDEDADNSKIVEEASKDILNDTIDSQFSVSRAADKYEQQEDDSDSEEEESGSEIYESTKQTIQQKQHHHHSSAADEIEDDDDEGDEM